MPPAGRLGDKSQVLTDAHGCPSCPHLCLGPAISGSPNVNINRRSALRVGDTGIHSSCCGTNMWIAVTGAARVFINGKAAHRLQDKTQHCGGTGQLIEGSPNVLIGVLQNHHRETENNHWAQWKIVNKQGIPIIGLKCKISLPDGRIMFSETNSSGVVRFEHLPAGSISLEIVDSRIEKQ